MENPREPLVISSRRKIGLIGVSSEDKPRLDTSHCATDVEIKPQQLTKSKIITIEFALIKVTWGKDCKKVPVVLALFIWTAG